MRTWNLGRGFLAGRNGFSLVEVVVALIILSVSVAGTLSLSQWISETNRQGAQLTEAIGAAQAKLEDLKTTPFADLAGGTDTLGGYTRVWSVEDSDSVRILSVNVNWDGPRRQPKQVSLRTMVAP